MIVFHPSVRRDVVAAMRYYDRISAILADDFWDRFSLACAKAEANPSHFHFDATGWRRVGLERFPYHLLFEEELDTIRVMVLRHNRRNPNFGSGRK